MASKLYPSALRLKLGISLLDFSELIQCSLSLLSMTEAGKRNLPTVSVTLAGQIDVAAVEAEKIDINNFDIGNILQNHIDGYIRMAKIKLSRQQNELDEYISQAERASAFLKTAEIWLKKSKNTGTDTELKMKILQRKTLKKWKNIQINSIDIKIKIAGLAEEIAMAETLKVIL